MSDSQDRAKPVRKKPLQDQRQPRGVPGSVRWLKGLLGRPLELQRREGQLHVTLAERRRSSEQVRADELDCVREELRARLLSHDLEHAASVMRHLVFVHDALARQGWPGLGALPSRLLGKALLQTQMLVSQSASSRLALLIDRLRVAQVAAELRELREQQAQRRHTAGSASAVQVSEATHADFDSTARSRVATVTPEVAPLSNHD